MSTLPTVVIVGRPNVGKSTLFNRITASRRAIVGNEPGITRDRIHLEAEWKGRRFQLIDTGGMLFGENDEIPQLINRQVQNALEKAAHVVFMVDGRAEITSTDRDLADLLRRADRPLTLAVNKCDTPARETLAAGFHELGIRDVIPLSAEHGRNIELLLDQITAGFAPAAEAAEKAESRIRVAIVGRPNVGKSTLLNRLTGKERAMVSSTPGTTRDAVDEEVTRQGVLFQFVDTAGIRRKGKTTAMAEKLSVVMAQRHLRMSDAALVLIDGSEGVVGLDATIGGYAHDAGKALILVVNKSDQLSPESRRKLKDQIAGRLKFLNYAPVVFLSALTGRQAHKLFPLIHRVWEAAHRRVSTGELNRFLERIDFRRVSAPGARKPKIYYATQPRVAPPTFIFFTNQTDRLHFSFERFLINQLRRAFDFEGTPVVIRSKPKQR